MAPLYCPNCGQQQVSGETKFCSRCGLPLGLIAEVVDQGGYLPQLAQLNQKKTFFNKRNGVVFATLWFILLTMFATAFFAILDAPDELVGICAITGVFGSLMILIASLIFLPSSKPTQLPSAAMTAPQMPLGMAGRDIAQGALPPQQSIPAEMYRKPGVGGWRDTNDLQPTSVTEGTTRLLDSEELK